MAAYILLGSEEGEKIEFIRKERRKVFSSYPEAEEYTFFGGDEDGEGVSTALMESSLFSSYRFVVVKHFENVKKTDDLLHDLFMHLHRFLLEGPGGMGK